MLVILNVKGDAMQKAWLGWSCLVTMGAIALCPASTLAQLIPDNTLGAESSVITNIDELSDGTTVAINGRTEPTLDIRAGVDPAVVGSFLFNPINYFPFNFTNFIFNPNGGNPPNLSTTPTSADSRIGTIAFLQKC